MMNRISAAFLSIMLLAAVFCLTAGGQNKNDSRLKPYDRVPDRFQKQLSALGRRTKEKGKEKTVYSGQLFDRAGNASPVRITHQLPNLVLLEGFKPGKATLSFDGECAHGASSRSDEIFLETFTMDLPEGMLASIQASAAIRHLGDDFGPDPRLKPDYAGPRFSIFDVTDTIRCRRNPLLRARQYYFDSATGLLMSARYYDRSTSPTVRMETHFSVWGTMDGSSYPARMDHYENGEKTFTFIAEQIAGEPSEDIENFK